jgi:hypothetical protein
MQNNNGFEGTAIVSCGTMRRELTQLKEEGFLNPDVLLFTAPGLHEWQPELKKQLSNQLSKARESNDRIIVVYGERCYLDPLDPSGDVDWLLRQSGENISRVGAKNCIDMLASAEEREAIAAGQKVYWLTPGWFEYWRLIFKDFDKGMANETFPANDKAILLDPFNMFEEVSEKSPEKILEFSDFMGIAMEPHPVTLDRLKRLLIAEAKPGQK